MKFGVRKPSLKKSFKARTTGKLKRKIKKTLIPGYGKKGMGWIKNPKKAAYNKIYNKTTFSIIPKSHSKKKPTKESHKNTTKKSNTSYSSRSNATTYVVKENIRPTILEGECLTMKICKYCDTEYTNDVTICSSCGGREFKTKCGNCGNVYDNGLFCPNCGVKADEKAKKCPDCGTEYYSNACPNCGYVRTNRVETPVIVNATPTHTATPDKQKKERKTWLWVLGWIFIFPLPLTIILAKNQKLNKILKIAIIAIAWGFYLLFAFAGSGETTETAGTGDILIETESTTEQETDSTTSENNPKEDTATKESTVEDLVNRFNADAENKLVYVEDFVVSSKTSGHYRTEFRLTAYKDAVGKSYKMENHTVDIISTQSILGDIDVRIYATGITLDQSKELVKYASKILDPTMTDETIDETISYIINNKPATGYYYGELGLTFSGSDDINYNLMIKTD